VIPAVASFLRYSLALSARFSEAESLLREAINQASMMRMVVFHSQMMERAEGLGVRPLTARCHLGLGALYGRTGKAHEARVHLSTAARLLRAPMG
jgi:Flp pilus assembly protein TadD